MIRKSIISSVICLILGLSVTALNEGCKPYCTSVPEESPASVRILNAVSNVDTLLIYIDGKFFDRAYYDLDDYTHDATHPGLNFGYRETFISDGTTLRAGQHHIIAIGSVEDSKPDTILQSDYILYNHRQSIVCIGKMSGTTQQKPSTVYLNDVVTSPGIHSKARFIHAVPDIAGIDVNFDSKANITPNIRMNYGTISDAQGGDNGTGLTANDYYEFPSVVHGLVIAPFKDTLSGDYILNLLHDLPTSEFLVTIVVRGETKPSCTQPTTSSLVLEDGQESQGTYAFEVQTFGVRLVNATHVDSLNLFISNPSDQKPTIPRSGTLAPYPTQQKVSYITQDSVSDFMALSPSNPYYDFWFGADPNDVANTLYKFRRTSPSPSSRLTFIAIDTIPHDAGNSGISYFEMLDTVCTPTDTSMGRICFVNTTSDYTANFTFAGKPFSMKQRDVKFWDAPVGHYSIQVTDGATTGTIAFDVIPNLGNTVFFMPSATGNPVPIRTSTR